MNTYRQDVMQQDTHSKLIGYLLWVSVLLGRTASITASL